MPTPLLVKSRLVPSDPALPQENDNGTRFHKLLRLQSLAVPSTFDSRHIGADRTLVLASGCMLRRDFIAVPISFLKGVVTSYVDQEFFIATKRNDHFPVACRLMFRCRQTKTITIGKPKFSRSAI